MSRLILSQTEGLEEHTSVARKDYRNVVLLTHASGEVQPDSVVPVTGGTARSNAAAPDTLASARPVADLPDVTSLIELAERCDLLILRRWRVAVETFVVQEERANYRFHSGGRRLPAVPPDV